MFCVWRYGCAVKQVAKVDDKDSSHQDQQRCALAKQLGGDELGRACKDDKGHGLGGRNRQQGLGCQDAIYHSKREDTQQQWQLGDHA